MTYFPDRRYFRIDELSYEMRVCIETVRRWIRDDRIEHIHLPKKILIPRDEFKKVLKHGPRPKPYSAK